MGMVKERLTVRDLVGILIDFEPAEFTPSELLIGWKCIASETGFSEDTLQRCCAALRVTLPRWGPPGHRAPVCIQRAKVTVFRHLVMLRA